MRHRWLISLLVVAVTVGGCCIEPPLYLRRAVATEVELETKVNVDIMWQVEWKQEWIFDWDTTRFGPLGYVIPESMRLHMYSQGPYGDPVSHSVYNFMGHSTQMNIIVGTYNMLFHNNNSEALLFRSDDDLGDVYSYTREISKGLKSSSPVYTQKQKAMGMGVTKADENVEEPVSLPPDDLFSLYDTDRVITDNPADYVYENGRYVLKIEGEVSPSTYIYLIQVILHNNLGRVVGSNGGAAITGMAGGVDLMTRQTFESTVSVPMDVYYSKDQDMLGSKVYTFGIPGCNPYDEESVKAVWDKIANYYVLNISYVNGSYRNIRVDITDQVRKLPLGGVITIELDVNDFPPDESAGGGGGFDALIGEWDEERGDATVMT